MTRRDRKRLQGMIDRTAKASAEFHREQAALMDWCRERYGFEPGDHDADTIIDAVLGGCGITPGMSADDFDAAMLAAGQ